jgi:hypothetical protein
MDERPGSRPQGYRVLGFEPDATRSLETSAGGAKFPLITLALYGSLLAGLSWLWLRPETFASNTSGGSIFITLKMLMLLSLAFLAAGAVVRTARLVAGRSPSRRATLHLTGGEPSIERGLHGEVHLSWRLRPDETAVALLECVVSSPLPDSLVADYRWYWEQAVDAVHCPPGLQTRIPVSFNLPENAPPSGSYQVEGLTQRAVAWVLWLQIQPAGPRLLTFRVPIAGAGGGPSVLPRDLDRSLDDDPSPARPASSRIEVRPRAEGTEYRFPRMWAHGFLAAWTVATAPAWIVLPWMAWHDARDWPGNLLFMIVVLLVVNAAPLALLMAPRRLFVGPDGVVMRRLLRPSPRMHIRSIRNAAVTSSGASGNLARDVVLALDSGSMVAVHGCLSCAEARWLAADVNRALERARAQRDAKHR